MSLLRVFNIQRSDYVPAYGIHCASLSGEGSRSGVYPTFCRVPAGGATTEHDHFEAEVYLVVSGTGTIRVDHETSPVGPGDLVRIPPFARHQLTNSGTEELVFLSVYSEDFEVPALPTEAVVTSAPPTPNGPLHLGHVSGPYLASDVLARYLRLRSVRVDTHSSTDDHQNYVAESAIARGQEPEAYRQSMRSRILSAFRSMAILPDEVLEPARDPYYQNRIASFARRAVEAGIVQQEEVEFPFCPGCDLALVDALIEGRCPNCREESRGGCESCGIVVPPSALLQPRCSRCRADAVLVRRPVYTFDLTRHLPLIAEDLSLLRLPRRLRELVKSVQAKSGVKVWVTHPASAAAGIPMPSGDRQQVHVWFEMAAHYERFASMSESWIHCFGFDNAFYYLLFIPALLRAMNPQSKLPSAVLTNEFLSLEGRKFSTSRGHAIWADEAAREFDGEVDVLRFYLALNRPDPAPSDFSMDAFLRFSKETEQRLKTLKDRARALSGAASGPVTRDCLVLCNRVTREAELCYAPESFELRAAARMILGWMERCLEPRGSEADEKLMIRVLATLMAPVLPRESAALLEFLGVPGGAWLTDWARAL